MANISFKTFKTTDGDVFTALQQVANEFAGGATAKFIFHCGPEVSPIKGTLEELSTNDALQKILSTDAALIERTTFSIERISVAVKHFDTWDEITVSYPSNETTPEKYINLVAAVHKYFQMYERTEATDKLLGDELAEFYRKREQALLKLEDVAQNVIERSEAHRIKADEETEAKRLQLEQQYDERLNKLAESYEEKEKSLTEREATLKKEKDELDDRSNRHARRQIRRDLKGELEKRSSNFSLSKKTNKKRFLIHCFYLLLVFVPLSIFIYLLVNYQPDNISLPITVRLFLSALAFFAATIYYIRWNDQWFHQHADEEFRLKQLELDIDRASWVVEMALEWKEEKGTEIPPELVDRLSRNLFVREADSDAVRHPTEDFLSLLLGASSRLNLKIPPLGEMEMDRRGIKRLQKDTEKLSDD